MKTIHPELFCNTVSSVRAVAAVLALALPLGTARGAEFNSSHTFTELQTVTEYATLNGGTAENPNVFTASDDSFGINQTGGNTENKGVWQINGGTYTFGDDYLSYNNTAMTLLGGTASSLYWTKILGHSSLTIAGGSWMTGSHNKDGVSNNGSFVVGEANGDDATVTVSGGALTASSEDTNGECGIRIGAGDGSKGTLNISSGAVTNLGVAAVGYYDNSIGVLSVSGGEMHVTGFTELGLGVGANASMAIAGGKVDTDDEFIIACGTGSRGTLTQSNGVFTPKKFWVGSRYGFSGGSYGRFEMTGGSLATDSGEDFVVGGHSGSTGAVEVANATINVGRNLLIPWADNAVGQATVNAGTTLTSSKIWLCDSDFTSHDTGSGSLAINGGSVTTSGEVMVAKGKNTTATLSVTGGEVSIADKFILANGEGSAATFSITGGRVASTKEMFIGYGKDSETTVHMTGGALETEDWFAIARAHNTSVSNVRTTFTMDGGTITNANMSIGSFAGLDGDVVMDVNGGDVYSKNQLNIAENLPATVTLDNATMAAAGEVKFACREGANATMTIGPGGVLRGRAGATSGTGLYLPYGGGNATLVVNGGTIDSTTSDFYLGYGAGTGTLTINSGLVNATNKWIKIGSSGTSTINLNGGELVTGRLNLDANDKLTVNFNGGTLTYDGNNSANGDTILPSGLAANVGARGIVLDNSRSSQAIVAADLASGVETTETDGGLVKRGSGVVYLSGSISYNGPTVVEAGTLKIAAGDSLTGSVDVRSGTTLIVGDESSTASSEFSGPVTLAGTLVKNGSGVLTSSGALAIPSYVEIDVEKGSVKVAGAVSGAGSIAKSGKGLLVLPEATGHTGATTVEDGSLQLVKGAVLSGSLVVGGKGLVAVDCKDLEESETPVRLFTATGGLTLPVGQDVSDSVVIVGQACAYALSYDETEHAVYATVSSVKANAICKLTTWMYDYATAEAKKSYLHHTDPWSNGIPGANDIAFFSGDAYVLLNGDSDKKDIGNILVRGGRVLFKAGTPWPNLTPRRISGAGAVALSCVGLETVSGVPLLASSGVTIEAAYYSDTQDTWFDSGDTTITLNGPFVCTNGIARIAKGITFNGPVTITTPYNGGWSQFGENGGSVVNGKLTIGGANYEIKSGNTVNGDIEVVSGGTVTFNAMLAEGSAITVDAGGTLTASSISTVATPLVVDGTFNSNTSGFTVSGDISGSGVINHNNGTCTLTGDNSAFAGTFNKTVKDAIYFNSNTAGSALADWNIGGDIRTAVTSGTLQFGSIHYYKRDGWNAIYLESATDMVYLEIGANGKDSNLGTSSDICFCNGGADHLSIRKVGEGNLDLWFNAYQTLDLSAGTATLQNDNGPSNTFVFNGGTLRLGYDMTWDVSERFDFENSTGPTTIDTNGHNAQYNAEFSGTHKIVKNGLGTLRLYLMPTTTGEIEVNAGRLVLPYKSDAYAVTVASGADVVLSLEEQTIAEGGTFPVSGITLANADQLAGIDDEYVFTVAETESGYNLTASYDPVNRWIGGKAGSWQNVYNWSRWCVPTDKQTVAFDSSVTVTSTGSGVYDMGVVSNLVLNANVVFQNGNKNRQWPSIRPGSVGGTGSMTFDWFGLRAQVGKELHVTNDITLLANGAQNNWFNGESGGDLYLYGTISNDVGAVLDVNGRTFIHGKVIGAGTVWLSTDAYLMAGGGVDDVLFSGNVNPEDGSYVHINAGSTHGTNATWNLSGDFRICTDVSSEQILRIGALNASKNGNHCMTYLSDNQQSLIIETGFNNQDSTIDSQYFFGNGADYSSHDKAPVTIRKYGTGTMYCGAFAYKALEIHDGTLVNAHEWNIDDSRSGERGCDSVSVDPGAVFMTTAAFYADTMTLAPGAVLRSTLKAETATENDVTTTNGFSTVAWPTVAGEVGVEGVKVEFTNPAVLNDALNGEDADLKELASRTKYRLLNATRITGDATLETALATPGKGIGWSIRTVPGADSGMDLVLKRACRSSTVIVR